MTTSAEPLIRPATGDDVESICDFGNDHIRNHYAPLIGAAAADAQVRDWWNPTQIGAAVANGLVVIAAADGELLAVGQRGRYGDDHVIYKLYLHPQHRGRGLGPRLLDSLIAALPAGADRLYIEHFAGNERAGAFYEREGFLVQRIEPGPSGDPALDQVWRARRIAAVNR